MPFGNLLAFLRINRVLGQSESKLDEVDENDRVDQNCLLSFALQIACGMEHLSQLQVRWWLYRFFIVLVMRIRRERGHFPRFLLFFEFAWNVCVCFHSCRSDVLFCLHSFKANVSIIRKPVNWFTVQINWLFLYDGNIGYEFVNPTRCYY